MDDGPFFGLYGHHLALAAVGGAITLAYWLPRRVSRREPAASRLLILLGMAAFALVPGMPAASDPRAAPYPCEVVVELTVIIALFGSGLRIYDLSSLTCRGPTVRTGRRLTPPPASWRSRACCRATARPSWSRATALSPLP